jgi:hypothetical protein
VALNAAVNWEVRTAGNDTNGGGFQAGASGTDMGPYDNKNTSGGSNCFSTSADLSVTDAVTAGTTTITSATANFSTNIVGNVIYVQGGTGSVAAGWYQVATRVNSTTITVDRSTGLTAGTGVTLNIGGALASLGQVAALWVGNNTVYVKSGTYSVTSASTNISGGCVSSAVTVTIEGYNSSRGDLGTKPLIQATGSISTFTLITLSGGRGVVTNLSFDGQSYSASRGISIRGAVFRCKFSNFVNSGVSFSITGHAQDCEATGCSVSAAFTSAVAGSMWVDCVAHDNTGPGFNCSGNGSVFVRCIADTNIGAPNDGFISSSENVTFVNCVAYNNGRDGFRLTDCGLLINCIAETNTTTGFNLNSANVVGTRVRTCAYYGNGTNISLGTIRNVVEEGSITGSGSFFTDAPNSDFSLNATAGGGAACRAAGYPGVLPFGGTGKIDVGALQHADPVSGGGNTYSRGRVVNG